LVLHSPMTAEATETSERTKRLSGAQSSDLTTLSIGAAAELVGRNKVSPVELTKACLARIEQLNPALNVFITLTADSALAQAREAEAEVQRGNWRGPLHGIPIALKDLFDTAGVRTTAASALFKDRVPNEDAEVVHRLKAAGAVFLGKLNMHEFAYGGSSIVSYFGPVHNPWELGHITGGSSGGSAAAVAAGLCYGALGSDTGGSIRQPAAYCGIVGLKPTYGLVSTRGVIPLSWSRDHVGPMTRTVPDAALMLQAIAGYDPREMTSEAIKVPDYTAVLRMKGPSLRLGIPRDFFFADLDQEIETAMKNALSVLEKLTAGRREVTIPLITDGSVLSAEAYAYHAEFIAKTPELYQPETLKRLRMGSEVNTLAYVRGCRALAQLRRAIGQVFESVDALVTPTTPVPPPAIPEISADEDYPSSKERFTLRNTAPFNNYGLPTISIPCGFTSTGLPIGLQISGRRGGEAGVLQLAHAYEQATDWHKRHPSVD
jgi:aspartyl-tRNA(Asn)/glutamyl-tRNA(Gln) amidotransferase subunit A